MSGFKWMCCKSPKVDEGVAEEAGPGSRYTSQAPSQGPGAWNSEYVAPPSSNGAWNSEYIPPTSAISDEKACALASTPSVDKKRSLPPVKWVIGFDFGTTFSGFAYAKASGPEEISVYYDWPSRTGEKPYCKTLTGLYYKKIGDGSKLQCASWGHMARSDFMTRKGGPNGYYLSKFKLLLKKDLNDPALEASIPAPLTVHSVIIDYLRFIGELAMSVIQSHEGEKNFNRDSVQWCVTVPSIWDENAKQQMKACMVNAGLVGAGGIDAVKVVLEPEAASFHCHQILRQEHKEVSLRAKDKILVADVGGGTVDIVVQELIGTGQNYQVPFLQTLNASNVQDLRNSLTTQGFLELLMFTILTQGNGHFQQDNVWLGL